MVVHSSSSSPPVLSCWWIGGVELRQQNTTEHGAKGTARSFNRFDLKGFKPLCVFWVALLCVTEIDFVCALAVPKEESIRFWYKRLPWNQHMYNICIGHSLVEIAIHCHYHTPSHATDHRQTV